MSLHLDNAEDLAFLRDLIEGEPAERPQIDRYLLGDLVDAAEERNRLAGDLAAALAQRGELAQRLDAAFGVLSGPLVEQDALRERLVVAEMERGEAMRLLPEGHACLRADRALRKAKGAMQLMAAKLRAITEPCPECQWSGYVARGKCRTCRDVGRVPDRYLTGLAEELEAAL